MLERKIAPYRIGETLSRLIDGNSILERPGRAFSAQDWAVSCHSESRQEIGAPGVGLLLSQPPHGCNQGRAESASSHDELFVGLLDPQQFRPYLSQTLRKPLA
jgi:hypothetical protein